MIDSTDIIFEYLKSFDFKDNVLLNTPCSTDKIFFNDKYKKVVEEYFKYLPGSNLSTKTYNIGIADSGTTFIKALFKKYVDTDTLVISTIHEHENVKKCLDECRNKILLESDKHLRKKLDDILLTQIKKYKKVFVYIIGTQISTGEITPQQFFIDLKQKLDEYNCSSTFVLDDVHGMFFVPRDYSLFDHILYTAHAIIPAYEMGVLISKKDKMFGESIYNFANDYLPRLKIVLENIDKLSLFKPMLTKYFSVDIDNNPYIDLYQNTVNHIFALKLYNLKFTKAEIEELKQYNIRVNEENPPINFIRIRFQEFLLQNVTQMQDGLQLVKKILIRIQQRAKFSGE